MVMMRSHTTVNGCDEWYEHHSDDDEWYEHHSDDDDATAGTTIGHLFILSRACTFSQYRANLIFCAGVVGTTAAVGLG